MHTAAKVVNGRKYQTWVGIFATHKKKKKLINPASKALPAKAARALSASPRALGKTWKLFTQAATAPTANPIQSHRVHGSVGATASDKLEAINAGTKPICDRTDQSCASRIIGR